MTSGETWYLCRDGRRIGPMTKVEIEASVAAGEVLPTDDVWTPRFAGWKAASEVFRMEDEAPPPPVPPAWLKAGSPAPGRKSSGSAIGGYAVRILGGALVLAVSFGLGLRYLPDVAPSAPPSPSATGPAATLVVPKDPPKDSSKYLPKGPPPWRYPAPLDLPWVTQIAVGTDIEIPPPTEFAGIVPNPDPAAGFVSFVGAYVKGDRKGWRYEIAVRWNRDVVVKRILINRNADCAPQGRTGRKFKNDMPEEIVNLCDAGGVAKTMRDPDDAYPAWAGTTRTPVPIHEITFETDLGTFSYDTRGLTLREQN